MTIKALLMHCSFIEYPLGYPDFFVRDLNSIVDRHHVLLRYIIVSRVYTITLVQNVFAHSFAGSTLHCFIVRQDKMFLEENFCF